MRVEFNSKEENVSKWAEIVRHDKLETFPCAYALTPCADECPEGLINCSFRTIYHKYRLLLAVVEAELDGVTPETKAESNRRLADAADRTQQAAPGPYTIKAKAWESLSVTT